MAQNQKYDDVSVDLRELFAILWSHKLLITLLTGLFIFISGNYAVNAKKEFTASSIFQIEEENETRLDTIKAAAGGRPAAADWDDPIARPFWRPSG